MTEGVIGGNISPACYNVAFRSAVGYKYLLTLSYDRTIFYDEWNDTFDNVRAYCLFITRNIFYNTASNVETSRFNIIQRWGTPVQSQSMSVALYRHLHRGEFTENNSSKDSVSFRSTLRDRKTYRLRYSVRLRSAGDTCQYRIKIHWCRPWIQSDLRANPDWLRGQPLIGATRADLALLRPLDGERISAQRAIWKST